MDQQPHGKETRTMNSPTTEDRADSRIDALDRSHGVLPFYRDLDRAKQNQRLAFAAYEGAMRNGDLETAELARDRFLIASRILAGRRGAA